MLMMEVVSSASQGNLSMMSKAAVDPDPPTPDPDAIKMFVGQVPRSMDEVCKMNTLYNSTWHHQEELKEFFSEFGSVHQLNILRDKSTGVSRCLKHADMAFVPPVHTG